VGNQQADFKKRAVRVQQAGNALAGGQLAGLVLFLGFGGAASRLYPAFESSQTPDKGAHAFAVWRGAAWQPHM
jgi:hypothetical protein